MKQAMTASLESPKGQLRLDRRTSRIEHERRHHRQ
jgi:hypothetical protein